MKTLGKVLIAIAAIMLFILALELLKQGAGGFGPFLKQTLRIHNAANTLGFGWLFAYVVLSGSPVAAIALSFFATDTLDAVQTFAMITGSRLGASFIVLFVGFLYFLRGHQRAASISIGILCLLVTATVYLPAMAIGYWLLTRGVLDTVQFGTPGALTSVLDLIYAPITAAVVGAVGRWPVVVFGLGMGTLLVSFNLLDRALPEIDAEGTGFERIGMLVYRPLAMFLLGMAITSVTLSVSVSLSILVPLSAKGFIRRENTVPYIMGANITTFIDTLFAALLMGGARAFTIVLVEMLSVALISVLLLLFGYRWYERGIVGLLDLIMRDNRGLALFMVVMLLVPIGLLLL